MIHDAILLSVGQFSHFVFFAFINISILISSVLKAMFGNSTNEGYYNHKLLNGNILKNSWRLFHSVLLHFKSMRWINFWNSRHCNLVRIQWTLRLTYLFNGKKKNRKKNVGTRIETVQPNNSRWTIQRIHDWLYYFCEQRVSFRFDYPFLVRFLFLQFLLSFHVPYARQQKNLCRKHRQLKMHWKI